MINLNAMVYPRLVPGVYNITILGWSLKTDKNNEQFVSIEFAPTECLDHKHSTALYGKEGADFLSTFIANVKGLFPETESFTIQDTLDFIRGKSMDSTLVENTSISDTGSIKTYYNWYLGYVAPTTNKSTTVDASDIV